MFKSEPSQVYKYFGIILLILVSFLAIYSPGTSDVSKAWIPWTNVMSEKGLIEGYKEVHWEYPPLAMSLLATAKNIHTAIEPNDANETFKPIKHILFLCFLGALFLYSRLKPNNAAYFAWGAALSGSAMLWGYLDILWIIPALGSLMLFKKFHEESRPLFLYFGIFFYTLACFFKWQPIIAAPFILLYVVKPYLSWNKLKPKFKNIKNQSLLLIGVSFIFLPLLMIAIFGLEPVVDSWRKVLKHIAVSAFGFNFMGIVQYFMHLWAPLDYGYFSGDEITIIHTPPFKYILASKILFVLHYSVVWFTYLFKKNASTLKDLVQFAIAGCLSYITFSTGVHENHISLLLPFWAMWVILDVKQTAGFVFLCAFSMINIFVFYGADGKGLGFSRAPTGIDLYLFFSLFEVVFYYYLIKTILFPSSYSPQPRRQ